MNPLGALDGRVTSISTLTESPIAPTNLHGFMFTGDGLKSLSITKMETRKTTASPTCAMQQIDKTDSTTKAIRESMIFLEVSGRTVRTADFAQKIKINGKSKNLGTFDTPEDASEFYQLAADMLHGEFAFHRSQGAANQQRT